MVSIHDDVLISLVVLMSKLLTKGFNSRLHESLLGIDVETAVSLTSEITESVDLV